MPLLNIYLIPYKPLETFDNNVYLLLYYASSTMNANTMTYITCICVTAPFIKDESKHQKLLTELISKECDRYTFTQIKYSETKYLIKKDS